MKLFSLVKEKLNELFTHNLTCTLCDRDVFEGEYFCKDCAKLFVPIGENRCGCCGRKTAFFTAFCDECQLYPNDFDGARSIFEYKDGALILVRKLKSKAYCAQPAIKFFESVIPTLPQVDIVTYVPMTRRAENIRGYNQSKLLAEGVAKKMGVECIKLFTKANNGKKQKTLDLQGRKANARKSFSVLERELFKDKSVLIVDDVMTTGSTLNALSTLLKRKGAAKVYCLTIASVTNKN